MPTYSYEVSACQARAFLLACCRDNGTLSMLSVFIEEFKNAPAGQAAASID